MTRSGASLAGIAAGNRNFQAPVLTDLASKIHLGSQPSSPGVISVQATGSQPPLFFVPTGWGDCSYVISLVKEMNVDCPVYALLWPSFDKARSLTLEAIADTVILAIKEIQPQGPYRFAGYSSGGILAYAIAQRLLGVDDTVSFMAFIDVTLFANRSSISPSQIVRNMVLERFESLDDESFEVLERFAGQCSIAQLLEKAQQIGAIPPDRDLHNDVRCLKESPNFIGRCSRIKFRPCQLRFISFMPLSLSSVVGNHLTNP
ncbi:hypothetical protein HNQ71_006947 [Mesorhizobium sangaii]|uniref:Thioesterase domain-containing protein n=1 Tax=Mesorhizobium sangaii TaxID=505389 RepID=A0A841PNL6_9HYPH|nr:hypothetical protein [Mesorhizobium sangaii]